MYAMTEVDDMSQAEFVAAFGAVFEGTPEIARAVWQLRPFQCGAGLYSQMVAVVEALPQSAKLDLIRAHPDLGSKAKMAAASVQEQAGVGLDCLSADEYDRFQQLNQAYRQKFGFPFIIAVKNHTKASILDAFAQRLQNSVPAEENQAIAEICQIARFRLHALVPAFDP
ncbi:MAG: 2-oxo-4-hydroxy-4-carboxy-5-ureidoimidazoline decarboxylase [Thermosynechococcaceae cyanobacterium]